MDTLIDNLLIKSNTEIKLDDNLSIEDFGIPEEILAKEEMKKGEKNNEKSSINYFISLFALFRMYGICNRTCNRGNSKYKI